MPKTAISAGSPNAAANHEPTLPLPLRDRARARLPRSLLLAWRFYRTGDWTHVLSFLAAKGLGVSLLERVQLIQRMYRISYHVPCLHTQGEMLSFGRAVLSLSPSLKGCVIEAGCFKGGSTAKLSLVARLAKRELVVFDSFEGIPENSEPPSENIWGGRVHFSRGDYCGSLREVQTNVARFGCAEACRFIQGWFDATMPHFHRPVAAAYLDVDLASSTRTCLRTIWPLLEPGGVLFSQDAHLPAVLHVFDDRRFWEEELRCALPEIHGRGEGKLIWIRKPSKNPHPLIRTLQPGVARESLAS